MKKAILCSVNSKFIHSTLAPWYLKEAAKNTGWKINILEWTINGDFDNLVNNILLKKPDLIGFSCYIWNMKYLSPIFQILKEKMPELVIILGGPEVSYNCKDVFEKYPVDYIISGEGEIPFSNILTAISSGSLVKGIPGVFGKDFESETFISCEIPPDPYTQEYFDTLQNRIVYFETVRGCPFSCSFCLSGRCGGMKYFPMDKVKEQLVKLANSGTKTIKFVDRSFNVNGKRALEIVRFIDDNVGVLFPNTVEFHFEIAGDILTDDLIIAFNTAHKGLFRLEIGLQSFNSKTLEAVNRKTNVEKLKENIKKLVSPNNVHIHIDLIAGLPYEDFDSFSESFNTAFDLKPHVLQLGFLKLLHGSPMEENPMGNFSDQPPYEVIDTPWLSKDDLHRLSFAEEALEKLYNSGRFTMLLQNCHQFFENPFQMFLKFGLESGFEPGESLDQFTEKVFNFFSKYVDKDFLRDVMTHERLITNSSGKLPPVLWRDTMGKYLLMLDKFPEYAREESVKRAAAYLKSSNEVLWVDYKKEYLIDGHYKANKISLDKLKIE